MTGNIVQYLKRYRVREAFEEIISDGSRESRDLILYQRILGINWNLFKLHASAPLMRRGAENGDSWMQYAWARYNDAVRPSEDSIGIAVDNYQKAARAGIPDAYMCLAYMWNEGEFGLVDRDRYGEYLHKALDMGSDMARLQQLRDTIWGNNGQDRDPMLVYDRTTQLISESGEDLAPQYCTVTGAACEALGRSLEAYTWYKEAFEKGDPKACLSMAILAGGQDEDGFIIRTDDFMKIVEKGIAMGIPNCEMFICYTNMEQIFGNLSAEGRERYRLEVEQHFSNAFNLGESDGAYILGECQYRGVCGFEKDLGEAWKWYMRGAVRNNSSCLQRLADMIVVGEAPSGFDLDFAYKCELLSLRFGNTDTLMNVVRAYRQGHLQDYAGEIERYYDPEYEERYDICP